MSLASKRIAILGAGIIGLSTAHRLLELTTPGDQKLSIDIIAEKTLQETTSDGAGGLYGPDDLDMSPEFRETTFYKWAKDSFEWYTEMMNSPDGGKMGFFLFSGYVVGDDQVAPIYKDIVFSYRKTPESELNRMFPSIKEASFMTTIGIETRMYMLYLMNVLKEKGVNFVTERIEESQQSFVDSHPDYDIIFNCLGLGAGKFCNDDKVLPIRGQAIRVKAPWLNHFVIQDYHTYIIPNVNTVLLGGCYEKGNWSTEVDSEQKEAILARCKEIYPSLESASIEWSWAGLRPYRNPIRVEKEIVVRQLSTSKPVILIHNYGHGPNGISLSRGTCVNAVDLLMSELATHMA